MTMWAAPWMHSHALGACWKCGGSGRIPAYTYIEGGVCFACDGTGHARNRRRRRQEPAPAPVADVAATLRADAAAAARAARPRDKEQLTPVAARNLAMQSLEEAGRWFETADNPRRLWPQGGVDERTMQEIYGYIGAHVGDAVVDHPLFVVALRKARRRVPVEHRDFFESEVAKAVRAAAKEYANIDTTIPLE